MTLGRRAGPIQSAGPSDTRIPGTTVLEIQMKHAGGWAAGRLRAEVATLQTLRDMLTMSGSDYIVKRSGP